MSSVRDKKSSSISDIKNIIDNSMLTIFSDYRGINANDMTALRKELKSLGVNVSVCKNTLSKIAIDSLELDYPDSFFQGPTVLISSQEDVVGVSKSLVNFMKTNDSLKIKGGFLQKAHVDESTIQELAKLPSRDELIAKTVGLIKSPLTGLVNSLSSPVRGLGNVLNSIKKKKDGGE